MAQSVLGNFLTFIYGAICKCNIEIRLIRDQKDGLIPPISASRGSVVERVSISLKHADCIIGSILAVEVIYRAYVDRTSASYPFSRIYYLTNELRSKEIV